MTDTDDTRPPAYTKGAKRRRKRADGSDGGGVPRIMLACEVDGCHRTEVVPASDRSRAIRKLVRWGWASDRSGLRCPMCEASHRIVPIGEDIRNRPPVKKPRGFPDGLVSVLYVHGGKSKPPIAFRPRGEDGSPTPESRLDYNEFIVARKLVAIGIEAWCGRRMEFIRVGKRRRAEPRESPYLRNYVFARIPEGRYAEVLRLPCVASTYHRVMPEHLSAFEHFREAVETEYAEGQRIRDNQGAVAKSGYRPGQALQCLAPGLRDQLLRFRRIVERAHDLFPRIEVEMEAMGRVVMVQVDPLDVRAAEGLA